MPVVKKLQGPSEGNSRLEMLFISHQEVVMYDAYQQRMAEYAAIAEVLGEFCGYGSSQIDRNLRERRQDHPRVLAIRASRRTAAHQGSRLTRIDSPT
jgi:hypothetical protein